MTERLPSDVPHAARAPMDDEAELRERIRRELQAVGRGRLPDGWNDGSAFTADLGLDSLDLVELVARLEQVTGIFVPDGDVAQLTSVSTTVAYVRAREEASADADVQALPRGEGAP